ncbi:MAG: PEP-CTERM sorting domain-containing protein [Akkermansiaceae bacterium]|jgi:hypothetical protein
MKKALTTTAVILSCVGSASATLLVDFNSNQASGGNAVAGDPAGAAAVHNEAGYESYHTNHESASHLNPATTASYNTTFINSGAVTVTLLPEWESGASNAVRQSIGRSQGQTDSWLGNSQNLLRDWIGTDSRAGGGIWDGTTGTPTYLFLTLGSLPADNYEMTTFHHDVENMNALFTTEISTDGGATYGSIINGRMTNSLAGGVPAENEILPGTGVNIAGGDPAALSSTQNLTFAANGSDDVVLRFAPLGSGQVHKMFFGINGFELDQSAVPEPSTGLLGLLGAVMLFRRRR